MASRKFTVLRFPPATTSPQKKHGLLLTMPTAPAVSQGDVDLGCSVMVSDFASGVPVETIAENWNIEQSIVLDVLRDALAHRIQPEEKLEMAASQLLAGR